MRLYENTWLDHHEPEEEDVMEMDEKNPQKDKNYYNTDENDAVIDIKVEDKDVLVGSDLKQCYRYLKKVLRLLKNDS